MLFWGKVSLYHELLLGDYTEIEEWIAEGRVDCGFLRLPTKGDFETIILETDRLMAIIPEDHPLADCEKFPVTALCDEPFMLLEKGAKLALKSRKTASLAVRRFLDYLDMRNNGLVNSGKN